MEDQEESNVPNRLDGLEDTSRPFEIEADAMRIVQDMQMMKEKMDMMMNALRGWVFTNLDELVHQIDSSFTAQVTFFPIPVKFQMPKVEVYDGSKDPLNHLESFKTLIHLQGVPDEFMCKAFPTTLKGQA